MRPFIALLLTVAAWSANAQPLQLSGPTLDGSTFNLQALRGRVVMLFFWNTDCVPCVQRMPELRANAAGWRGKPFTLVLVSTDRERQSALAYVRTLRQVDKAAVDTPFLWAGEQRLGAGLTVPASVPQTLVLDSRGEVVARHVGRIAPEAWDDVAELLP
ncbi:TlpA family protein disulfide reductase [Roseateles puraquae]|jgi:thiol-disulfide isomerase/thioredoxin|uniref:Redoxin n=1 Tax=Roseateles puraquae TaxID=431059 RepID=A0A254N4B6_9BURK|nr:TlpA disulfide reductase family protein [Roseateles puraquae]MDG0853339.1 TlpA family protein disulfide reductase [Roseateles puraquae]OWR02919.1 redoxin [Roseateles puraquae]